jgi:hypothetical protein
MADDKLQRIRRTTGYVCLGVIGFYLLISLCLLAFPKKYILGKKLSQYYKWIALPGPFFREDRIRVDTHIYIAYKTANDEWTPRRNIQKENFLKYHDNFFAYNALKRSRYERYLAKALVKKINKGIPDDLMKLKIMKEVDLYLKKNYLPQDVDSVEVALSVHSLKDKNALPVVIPLKYKSKR